MSMVNIYSVSDSYIDFLRQDPKLINVFDNKENQRSNTRKYLGVALQQNSLNYFIPFSSPKESDYIINESGGKNIRKSIIPIVRMTTLDTESGKLELKGTLKISNMIPVPASELIPYDINLELDLNYKSIVSKEYHFIKHNFNMITKNASVIYNQKTQESTIFVKFAAPNYLKNTIDFLYAEKKCNDFIKQESLQYEKEVLLAESGLGDSSLLLAKASVLDKLKTAKGRTPPSPMTPPAEPMR